MKDVRLPTKAFETNGLNHSNTMVTKIITQ